MNRRKMAVISSAVIVLVLASFYVGTLFSPYGVMTPYGPLGDSGVVPPTVIEKTGAEPAYLEEQTLAQERMVIYNGYISLETSDIQGRLDRIRQLAENYGGYVAGSSRSGYGTQATAEISIRIPKERFHEAVRQIETYGKVLDERTTSEDITQQYVDLKARLNNLEKQEQRLHEILGMAKTVDEILRVESELSRIRGEIESLQGQINYLESSAKMSLISVSLIEPAPPFTPPGMDWGETLETAILGLFTVLRGLMILIVSLIPLAIIGLPIYYVYRRRRRQKEKR